MANRKKQPNIPQWGEWKDGGGTSTPYTVVFDNARIKKNNPDNHSQNQGSVRERLTAPKSNAAPPPQSKGRGGERREEKRYPPRTPSPVGGHQSRDAVVPQFGGWNDPNTSTQCNYTVQFDKLGEEKKREKDPAGSAPPPLTHQTYIYTGYEDETISHHSSHMGTCRCVIL